MPTYINLVHSQLPFPAWIYTGGDALYALPAGGEVAVHHSGTGSWMVMFGAFDASCFPQLMSDGGGGYQVYYNSGASVDSWLASDLSHPVYLAPTTCMDYSTDVGPLVMESTAALATTGDSTPAWWWCTAPDFVGGITVGFVFYLTAWGFSHLVLRGKRSVDVVDDL